MEDLLFLESPQGTRSASLVHPSEGHKAVQDARRPPDVNAEEMFQKASCRLMLYAHKSQKSINAVRASQHHVRILIRVRQVLQVKCHVLGCVLYPAGLIAVSSSLQGQGTMMHKGIRTGSHRYGFEWCVPARVAPTLDRSSAVIIQNLCHLAG